MNNVWTVMSKEFTRFFTDRRMVVMTLMPAILIYVVYSFMGSIMGSTFAPDEDLSPWIYAVDAPETITRAAQGTGVSVMHIDSAQAGEIKENIAAKEPGYFVLAVFPGDFEALIESYDVRTSNAAAPNIEIYYNSTVPNSYQTYFIMTSLLDGYESSLANKFDVNRDIDGADLATAEDQAASIISMLMPMLLMIFLYSGCMGLALESITGEKERGTLATLLVSPLKRSELAVGKILSLAALSFISGLATAVATILSLPNLMGGAGTLDVNIYSTVDYVLLALVILTTLLVIVAMLSIVSAFAKTVKEAGQAATPLMIVVMVVGISGMFGGGPSNPAFYLIPLYGSVQSMNGIFSLDYDILNIALSCASSLLYAIIGGFILTKMFNSEKVMFSR